MSQESLAQVSGVSRQAIAGIESGKWKPSLKVALSIAKALDTTVEAIFSPQEPRSPLLAEVITPTERLTKGTRVRLANLNGKKVAFPLQSDTAMLEGFLPANALVTEVIDGETATVASMGEETQALVLAGCDPALALLAQPLLRLGNSVDLIWWPCSSTRALQLLSNGLVHGAGIHLRDADKGTYNLEAANSLVKDPLLIGFSIWREGIVLAPHLADKVDTLADIAKMHLSIVNREPGSEARNILEREIDKLEVDRQELLGYETTATGHLTVASCIAAGAADAGVASEPAALTYGLAFLPLSTERYDLVIPAHNLSDPVVQALITVLGDQKLRLQLSSIPGYDGSICGEVV
jgi:molybdate-binding protein/DNA-binding XRE family transcriptional regulator